MKRVVTAFLLLMSSAPIQAEAPKVELPAIRFELPPEDRVVLSNGLVVYLAEDHELPLFELKMHLRSTPAFEVTPDAFTLLSTVWRNGGTKTRTPDAFNLELEKMSAQVEVGVGNEEVSVSAASLMKDRDATLAIMMDLLLNPAFRADQLTLAKSQKLEEIRRKNETPDKIGRRAFRDILYGPRHPYAENPTEKTVAQVSRGSLQKMHKNLAVPDGGIVSVVGDFDREEMIATLEKLFAGWKKTGRSIPPFDYTPRPQAAGTLFTVQKESPQSRISMGRIGISRHHPDTFPLALADYILGGGGPSRLFAEIRSRKGLAYVVGSFYTDPVGPGMAGVVCQTGTLASVQATREILNVLDRFAEEGPTPSEIQGAKDALIQSFVFKFESPAQIVDSYASREFYGYPEDHFQTYRSRVAAVTAADIRRVARKYFSKEGMKILVVGDASQFKEDLSAIGPVEEIPLGSID